MKSTTASALIEKLEKNFMLFGYPTKIVTDNGPPFSSAMFKKYCDVNSIFLQHSPPYHPQSNGLAERGVQTAKKALIRFHIGKESELSTQSKLDKYLSVSRNTPSIESGRTPAEIIFSFKPKVKLDIMNDALLKKSIDEFKYKKSNSLSNKLHVTEYVNSQPQNNFEVGENVYYRCHFKNWIKWIPAKIKKQVSPLTYLIDVSGNVRYVQENQIRYPTAQDKHSKIVTTKNSNDDNTPFSSTMIEQNDTQEFENSLIDNSVIVIDSSDNSSAYMSVSSNFDGNVTVNDSLNINTDLSTSDVSTPMVGKKRKAKNPPHKLRRSKRNKKVILRFGNNVYDRSML